MAIVPYQHQKEALWKLGKPNLTSRLIADDMGLGKTLEALMIDGELRSERHYPDAAPRTSPPYKRPTLIIAPMSSHYDAWVKAIRQMHDNWSEEAFDRNIAVIDSKDRSKLVARLKDKNNLPCFVIVHYEALRLMPELQDIKWFHIIADEVHRAKNRKAQQTHYLKALKTFYKTGISGTPADDKPQDIYSILHWLYPQEYKSYWKFVGTYCQQETQEVRGQGRTFRKIVGVNKEALPRLHKQWDPWYIRRTKESAGVNLPGKYYTELHVDLLPGQRRMYEQMRKDMIAWIGERADEPVVANIAVAQLIRLQQFALASASFNEKGKLTLIDPSSKLDRLMEIIDGNPNESIVIFSQSKSMVNLVVRRATAAGISCVPYTGDVPQHNRVRYVEAFQAGDVQLFAGTIAAGGESITLHRSSTVVFLDRMWNPTKNVQAEDRLDRIGQVNKVQVIDIMARDTVDRGRHQRIASKWEELLWLLGDKKMTLQQAAEHDAVAMFMGGM
jgi:SNF2 family DNA or RNA helicase